jgi:AmmeMemoRadiSam system protein A
MTEAAAAHGQELVRFARARVRQELGGPVAVPPDGAWCTANGATFVTLRWRDGDLQGCIGTLEADRGIVADVASNAVAAATRDPRGEIFGLEDVDDLDVELSILSPLEPISGRDAIRVGTDGIVLVYRGRRATFLPVMWKQLPDLATFMRELERKLGLPKDVDRSELQFLRYTAEHFEDLAP